jgi:hypothetical protein
MDEDEGNDFSSFDSKLQTILVGDQGLAYVLVLACWLLLPMHPDTPGVGSPSRPGRFRLQSRDSGGPPGLEIVCCCSGPHCQTDFTKVHQSTTQGSSRCAAVWLYSLEVIRRLISRTMAYFF